MKPKTPTLTCFAVSVGDLKFTFTAAGYYATLLCWHLLRGVISQLSFITHGLLVNFLNFLFIFVAA